VWLVIGNHSEQTGIYKRGGAGEVGVSAQHPAQIPTFLRLKFYKEFPRAKRGITNKTFLTKYKMTEAQTIDWFIKTAELRNKSNMRTREDDLVFKAMCKTMQSVKEKLKRVDYFGGVETLIAKASIQGQSEKLFSE